jgi:hypothetical protein
MGTLSDRDSVLPPFVDLSVFGHFDNTFRVTEATPPKEVSRQHHCASKEGSLLLNNAHKPARKKGNPIFWIALTKMARRANIVASQG